MKWYGYEREPGLDIGGWRRPYIYPRPAATGPEFSGAIRPTVSRHALQLPGQARILTTRTKGKGAQSEDPAEVLPAMDLEAGETLHPGERLSLLLSGSGHTKKLRNVELRWEPVWGEPPKAVLKLVSLR